MKRGRTATPGARAGAAARGAGSGAARLVRARLAESLAAQRRLATACGADLVRAAELAADALRAGGTLFLFGNGGSAADAQHWAAEAVGRYRRDRRALRAVALTTDTSVLTSVGNDYGYDRIFERQVEAHVRPGDVVVAISTSGRSPNVLRGVAAARRLGACVIGLTGRSGGKLAAKVDVCLRAPTDETDRIQECHGVLGHIFCDVLEQALA